MFPRLWVIKTENYQQNNFLVFKYCFSSDFPILNNFQNIQLPLLYELYRPCLINTTQSYIPNSSNNEVHIRVNVQGESNIILWNVTVIECRQSLPIQEIQQEQTWAKGV